MIALVVPLRFSFASECDSVPARVARVAPANGFREAIAAFGAPSDAVDAVLSDMIA